MLDRENPGSPITWPETPILRDSAGWARLEEHGWDALGAWLAGPQRVGRMPEDDSSRLVRVECETGGVITHREEPFTAADRALVEGYINDFLAFAGVPPRPVGFTWFLLLPTNWPGDRDFRREIHRIINDGPYPQHDGDRLPAEYLGAMREAVDALYRERTMPDSEQVSVPTTGDSGTPLTPG